MVGYTGGFSINKGRLHKVRGGCVDGRRGRRVPCGATWLNNPRRHFYLTALRPIAQDAALRTLKYGLDSRGADQDFVQYWTGKVVVAPNTGTGQVGYAPGCLPERRGFDSLRARHKHMDNLRIGHIIEGEQHRDAIHMAVAPVIAAETLQPGEHVGFVGEMSVGRAGKTLGIVDPFLKDTVYKGQRFWMLLYPGSITSLRHEWEHPAFIKADEEVDRTASQWLQDFAKQADMSVGGLIQAADDYLKHGTILCDGSRWEGVYAGDDFWDQYEYVKGVKVPETERDSFFSCSC